MTQTELVFSPRTESDWIVKVLAESDKPLACHEICEILRTQYGIFYNESSVSARTRELENLVGNVRQGKRFKEWRLV